MKIGNNTIGYIIRDNTESFDPSLFRERLCVIPMKCISFNVIEKIQSKTHALLQDQLNNTFSFKENLP